ncbi:hypothetical protein [Metapseudomonas otitidis]|uniref:hypothetical protein n=1 Tax=Metapseudomonas otitidis TaxID=319939 RepID=UPI001CA3F723|nr:hypothetical protein [Pseudomonas otitidis]QZX85718.1 hypothetical protein K6751_13780 [Pseudomonas otitidis]
MALNRTNERLRCVLKDASLNNRMACITLESAARQLEDPQLAEVLVKTARYRRMHTTCTATPAKWNADAFAASAESHCAWNPATSGDSYKRR